MLASPSVFQLPVAPRPREPQKTLADLTKRLDSGKSTQRRGPGQGEGRAQSREAGEGPRDLRPQDRHSWVYFGSSCLQAEQGEFRTGTEEKQALDLSGGTWVSVCLTKPHLLSQAWSDMHLAV